MKKIETSNNRITPDLEASQPDIEMFDQVSDIMTNNCRRNLMPTSPSKEIVLEETKTQPSYSYQKTKPSLSKKIWVPMKLGSKLKTEVKQAKKSDLRVNNSDGTFLERAFEQMNSSAIRKELFKSNQRKKEGLKN